MKKELKWTFNVIDIQKTHVPVYACDTAWGANCYFTRPLYDEAADKEEVLAEEERKGND